MSSVLEAVDSTSLVHSVSDVSALFQAAVSHGFGSNPAAVRMFRRRPRDPVSDVAALFRAAVSHGLGSNPAASRVFRRRPMRPCRVERSGGCRL